MFRVLRHSSRAAKSLVQGQKVLSNKTCLRAFSVSRQMKSDLTVTYDLASGEKYTVKCKEGENLLDVAINNDLDIDGFGACEGTLACSTCHLIFKQEDFDSIDEVATDEELDMLDLAFGLTDTSRLGCQVCMTKALDGLTVKVPEGINDQR
eukprot:TRINITY_DN79168_c0_g1_i1.p1 TRINITY_DN79168_c0_g1~~TRINITY_DN79168_c0_g1_i1.p1  ORF type:complete len:164 (+),score=21.40 TRINITY_DN79168_c0_g1_i1:40-492(+)